MHNKQKLQKHSWLDHAVVYQIYPRSFKDTTHNGVGDLQGIIERLDYLNDGQGGGLGVDAIWLSPIFCSPMIDFGYDISDHRNIDPLFGNLEIFDELVAQVHKRGMKLMLDFVPNHTSSSHPWFVESKSSVNNPKRDWYVWHDPGPDGLAPNNWLSVFGGSAWTFDEQTGQYYMHTFLSAQPDLNWHNPEVKKEMFGIMRWWLERGVDGFRVDAVPHLFEDKKLRDNPPNPNYVPGQDDEYEAQYHVYTNNLPETLALIKEMGALLDEHNAAMINEVRLGQRGDHLRDFYEACGDNRTCQPFNFRLLNAPWQAQTYREIIDKLEKLLWPDCSANWVFGNHDMSRLASRLDRPRARLVAVLQMTLRGTPFIYYGEELGMIDGGLPPKRDDQRGKKTPSRDPARTPMQWDASKNAGFSDTEPWLPVGIDYKEYNTASELSDPDSFLNLYKVLIGLRKTSPVLLDGKYESLETGSDQVLGFTRNLDKKKILVLLNFSKQPQVLSLPQLGRPGLLCATEPSLRPEQEIDCQKLSLNPLESLVLDLSL